MSERQFEFWYDISCPYAYLASTQIDALAAECGATVSYEPFLLGGVFRAIGAPMDPNETMPAAKAAHNRADMLRWAQHFQVPLNPPSSHPQRTVLALRALLAAGPAMRKTLTHRLFTAYWVDARNINDPAELTEILGRDSVQGAARQRDALYEQTQRAVDRGIFGAPAFVVDKVLYWGQDRLDFVRKALLER